MIPILNCATSVFAGFVVFSVLGYMAHKTGTSVDEVTTAGKFIQLYIHKLMSIKGKSLAVSFVKKCKREE